MRADLRDNLRYALAKRKTMRIERRTQGQVFAILSEAAPMIEALLVLSAMINVILAFGAWLARRVLCNFENVIQQKERQRNRVAKALVERFRYLQQAHQKDHDKLTPMANVVGKQGDAVRIIRSGFRGLAKAYGDAANDVQRFMVLDADPTELLKDTLNNDNNVR